MKIKKGKPDAKVPISSDLSLKTSLAPDVDITDLQYNKQVQELTRFERETKIETSQNHLTGFLQEAQLDRARFNE